MTRARPKLIGHRGAPRERPENTLPSFLRALELQADGIELDVHCTIDRVVVVHHDIALNPDIARGPDGAWLAPPTPFIKDLTRADLARYDVGRIRPGSPTASRYPDQVPEDGARIPALADILALPAHFTIEIKSVATRPGGAVRSMRDALAALRALEEAVAT